MGDDLRLRVAVVDLRLEQLDALTGDLGPTDPADQLLALATEHGPADDFEPTAASLNDLHVVLLMATVSKWPETVDEWNVRDSGRAANQKPGIDLGGRGLGVTMSRMWTQTTWRGLLAAPVIGMIHLRPLPGSPDWDGNIQAVEDAALDDAEALGLGGIGALMLENYGDVPFYKDRVPPETIAAMTRIGAALRHSWPDLPLGVNVLRNDALAALGIAAALEASFVRINVLAGAMLTDQGIIEGRAAEVLRRRRELGVDVGLLADLRVKHAASLAERPLVEEAEDLRLRAHADALVLTGAATGAVTDPALLAEIRRHMPECPLMVGSGMTIENLSAYEGLADAFIVGSSLKRVGLDGRATIDRHLVGSFVDAAVGMRDTSYREQT